MYCGYDCNTMLNNAFAYSPDCKVFLQPSTFQGIRWKERKNGKYKICLNQGFPTSGNAYRVLVGPLTKMQAWCLYHDVCNYLLQLSNIHTLLQQASKWDMRGLHGTFPYCKNRLPSKSEQGCLVLKAKVVVHNFCM
jgi:hypothetical protein